MMTFCFGVWKVNYSLPLSIAATRTWTCATLTTRRCTGTRTCAPPWRSTATSSQTRRRSCCTPHPLTTRPSRLILRAKMAAACTTLTTSLCTECTLWPPLRQAAGEVWFRHIILSDMTSSTAVWPHMFELVEWRLRLSASMRRQLVSVSQSIWKQFPLSGFVKWSDYSYTMCKPVMLLHAIPCCARTDQAVTCCAMQYYAVPCHTMRWHVMPCCAMSFYAVPCHTMLCRALQCYSKLCRAMSCCAMSYYGDAMLCWAVPWHTMRCHVILCGAVSYYAMPCLAMLSCAILCQAVSLSCRAMSATWIIIWISIRRKYSQ